MMFKYLLALLVLASFTMAQDDNSHAHCPDDSLICSDHAKCTFLKSHFECQCEQGFVGNGTHCTDIDECIVHVDSCDNKASCFNLPGSFECRCLKGFTGDGTNCVDIDECSTGQVQCADNATCQNELGYFQCLCNPGFTGDGERSCRELDVCDQCGPNQVCGTGANNTKACMCASGFTESNSGDGLACIELDMCDQCGPNQVCGTGPNNTKACMCASGFTDSNSGDGPACIDIDECADIIGRCSSHSTCTNSQGSYTCTCLAGYTGDGFDCLSLSFFKDGTIG